jgi:hypothetical protein
MLLAFVAASWQMLVFFLFGLFLSDRCIQAFFLVKIAADWQSILMQW